MWDYGEYCRCLKTSIARSITTAMKSFGSKRPIVLPQIAGGQAAPLMFTTWQLAQKTPYGFIASIGSMRIVWPWLYELGTAAVTRALAGDVETARAILSSMVTLISTQFQPESHMIQNISPQLEMLFELLIASNWNDPMTDVDDLPF